jgi:predicted kinase
VAARVNDPSDADLAVLAAQAEKLRQAAPAQLQWRKLDASQPAPEIARQIANS